MILLRTKLYRPSMPSDLVVRPRLLGRFDQALSRSLTLVSAPAGYGKTMLVRSWLERCPLPNAWLWLDADDNDIWTFLTYLTAAVEPLRPGGLLRTRSLIQGRSLPPLPAMVESLVSDLDEAGHDIVLVLDDVHVIHEQGIFDLLSALLRHPSASLHLILVTRRDPPLPLTALRVRGQLLEFRAHDLRFSSDEASMFMEQATGTPLGDQAMAELVESTEGWAAALRLAALTMRYSVAANRDLDPHPANNRFVMDYLLVDVLSQVPPDVEDFLVRTAHLDYLCASLCDAVLGQEAGKGRGQAHLAWLEQNNLFTNSLDQQQVWYRYHSLFRSLLQHRMESQLSSAEVEELHRRASAWSAGNGRIVEALRHALAGRDVTSAVGLVAAHRHDLLNSDQRTRLERWLALFPAQVIAQHAELLLAQAWVGELGRANSATILAILEQAQALVDQMTGQPERARLLQAEISTVLSIEKIFAADDPAAIVALTSSALAVMPKAWYVARSEAWLWLAMAHRMLGEFDQAYATLAAAQREDAAEPGVLRVRNTAGAGFIHWVAADLAMLLSVSQQAVSIGAATDRLETLAWGRYGLAIAHYQRNELALAEQHALAVQELRYAGHPIAVLQCALVRASIHQARGEHQPARLALDQVREYLHEVGSAALEPFLDAFAAELDVRQGDLDTAGRWAMTVGPYIPIRIMLPALFYAPQFTLPRVLLAMNTPASRRQAADILAQARDFVASTHNTRFTIDVLAMQALLCAAEGDEPGALLALRQALTLARPGGLIRVFVEFGAPMARLLSTLARHGGALDGFAQQVLRAFPAASQLAKPIFQPVPPIEPLTLREQEILELLAQRLSAKEIAQRLFISDRTVKRHCANISEKLGVNSRREAVDAALAMGLLRME